MNLVKVTDVENVQYYVNVDHIDCIKRSRHNTKTAWIIKTGVTDIKILDSQYELFLEKIKMFVGEFHKL